MAIIKGPHPCFNAIPTKFLLEPLIQKLTGAMFDCNDIAATCGQTFNIIKAMNVI